MKYSQANAKLKALYNVPQLERWLGNKRKVYSADLISGHSCPFADECLSKVKIVDGRKKLFDGPNTKYRCFSASQEVIFPAVYTNRMHNFNGLRGKSLPKMVAYLESTHPENLGICRIHVAGDFFSPVYFQAWIELAKNNPTRLYYAYTKSLPYWLANRKDIPNNLVLTASYGGRKDALIGRHKLRYVKVVYSEQEARKLNLTIDHTDEHAAIPETKNQHFALLIHGQQAAGSMASKAIQDLKKNKVKFSYS